MASSSSDEGEIRDSEKANKSPFVKDPSVDRQDRKRSRYSRSPSLSNDDGYTISAARSRDRSRSPYRSYPPRGSKRYRDDDHYDRNHDPRRSKLRYDDYPSDRRNPPRVDLDTGRSSYGSLRYDDDDNSTTRRRRSRTRSRSPYRAPRHNERGNQRESNGQHRPGPSRDRDGLRLNGKQGDNNSKPRSFPVSGENHSLGATKPSEAEAGQSGPRSSQQAVTDDIEPESEPIDEAALIEERRKKREAIRAKYRNSATPLVIQAVHSATDQSAREAQSRDMSVDGEDSKSTKQSSPITSAPSTPREIQDPAAFAVLNKQSPGKANGSSEECEDDGPSAADYDPTMDMKEDKIRDATRHHEEYPSSAYDETHTQQVQDILIPQPDVQQPSIEKPEKDEFDMFGEDDDDDMFAEEKPSEPEAKTQAADSARAVPVAATKVVNNGMIDNWDDPEGYYKVILGELLENRYHVQANLGKGMFSSVVRALDTTTNELVAIKLIRANETMKKAGMKEIEIIQKLNDADKENKKHLIRLERYFEHKGHLCMVFEHLSINLREVLKKFGRDVGINLRAVRIYAQQMLLALSLMRKCNILHADLKPDNMLVNENRSVLKVCDLGSASDATENEITPYLVSRFYRAPEIILGMPYDFAIDIWSVGCTLYELYTGKILFVGRSNNQMLRSIMECRGKFTTKMLKRAEFAYMHFDQNANFLSVEQDKLTGRDTVKTLTFAKPTRDLRTRLLGASKGLSEEEMKDLNLFIDLLDKCLTLNPEKRCTPTEALKHPFISRVGK